MQVCVSFFYTAYICKAALLTEISSFKQAAKQSWGTLLYGMATGKLAKQM